MTMELVSFIRLKQAEHLGTKHFIRGFDRVHDMFYRKCYVPECTADKNVAILGLIYTPKATIERWSRGSLATVPWLKSIFKYPKYNRFSTAFLQQSYIFIANNGRRKSRDCRATKYKWALILISLFEKKILLRPTTHFRRNEYASY